MRTAILKKAVEAKLRESDITNELMIRSLTQKVIDSMPEFPYDDYKKAA